MSVFHEIRSVSGMLEAGTWIEANAVLYVGFTDQSRPKRVVGGKLLEMQEYLYVGKLHVMGGSGICTGPRRAEPRTRRARFPAIAKISGFSYFLILAKNGNVPNTHLFEESEESLDKIS